jgi:3-dehydrosphinganine reductase
MIYKNVLVTGGSSGIGLDLAKSYIRQGANVTLLARNQSRLDDAVKECLAQCLTADQKVLAFSVDVGDASALSECVAEVNKAMGTLDLLILSAGIVQSIRLMEQSEQQFNNIIQTNVMGSRLVVKAFLPEMIKAGKGHVCFVASLGGLIAGYGYSAYSASKFAVIGMAGALRQELHSAGVGVSVLCPPEVDTPMVTNEANHILAETRFIKDIGGRLSTATVAKATVRGINNNQFMIVPGFKAKLSYALSRYAPKAFGWFVIKMIGISHRFVK